MPKNISPSKSLGSRAMDLGRQTPEVTTNHDAKVTLADKEFLACRSCSREFRFKIDKTTLTIFAGPPSTAREYCAVSYVWGKADPLNIRCQKCGRITTFPMSSIEKFEKLLRLGAENLSLWIDALSIDQSDDADIARQVAVMGDIYKNAAYVGVLLPTEDAPLFSALMNATNAAVVISDERYEYLRQNTELGGLRRDMEYTVLDLLDGRPLRPDYEPVWELTHFPEMKCSELVQIFWDGVWDFWKALPDSTYWRRAWTFQEWALALDLVIRCESQGGETIRGPKTSIIQAAVLIARYKMHHNQSTEIDVGGPRGAILPRVDIVRTLFPMEDYYLADHEVDEKLVALLTKAPHFGLSLTTEIPDATLYGLRETLEPRDQESKFLARLSFMLSALGVVKKQARFEADLVCCWASMCNIEYDYSKHDSFVLALDKALVALRGKGIRIYNFVANTEGASGEVDRAFHDYATAHRRSNSDNLARIPGLPVFTGAMDTCRHLESVVTSTSTTACLVGRGTPLRHVVGGGPVSHLVSRLSDWDAVKQAFLPRVTGIVLEAGNLVGDLPHISFKKALDKLALDHDLSRYVFVPVNIPKPDEHGNVGNLMHGFFWAIFEAKFLVPDLFVALEELNQTLVLATTSGGVARIVAYLVATDLQAGSHLLTVDDGMTIRFTMRVRERADQAFVSPRIGTRDFVARIKIEEDSIIAY
ncbi:hypothetical protein FDECE_14987 [Fusarium decemcellulare]|nr:hypothetical protein FDECE_14987 [Fusarium decemcellulare]